MFDQLVRLACTAFERHHSVASVHPPAAVESSLHLVTASTFSAACKGVSCSPIELLLQVSGNTSFHYQAAVCHTLVQVPLSGRCSLLEFVSCFGEQVSRILSGGVFKIMPSSQRRIAVTAMLAAFVAAAMGGGCRGFFVNQPNSVAVTNTTGSSSTSFSVTPSATAQLKATATYNSGSKDVTSSASWTSSSSCATVNGTGVVTGVGTSSSITITATVAGVSGTITGSSTGGTSSTLTIAPTSTSLALGTQQFTATDSGGNNVTASSTWTSSDTTKLTFSTTVAGSATLLATGSVTVTASSTTGTCATGTASVTIGP
jgi:hypothetical protein